MTERKTHEKQRAGRSKSRGAQAARAAGRDATSNASALVVGIGASAGGLDAFKTFFAHMPADTGMAFVLVQHLDPHHKSMLVDLLARHAAMTVVEAEDRMPVAANRVFVIPPNATLTIRQGVLLVSKPAPAREHRRPIDTFFSSLAEDQGECAVSIVLSGTGSDGTLGLTTVKEHGGLTLAQAEFDSTAMSGMPYSAAATGLVDHIMRVEDMPAALVDYQRHLTKVAGRKDDDGARRDTVEHLSAISTLLRAGTGHDFSQYKPNTLIRRVQRRMQVLQIDTVPEYIERMRKEPHQVELLFREFLISVTQFFRDPQAFDALQSAVVPKLLENKGADDQVRIWVPGCATGEEVYSIAILVGEAMDRTMERRSAAPKVQIFGTDIDAGAVAMARAARYRKMMAGVSPERFERWFAVDGEEYCPVKEIREMCVFSTHSVVKDPPFSKLDLISCRNLLIYMDADLQDRVLRTFHYALRPDGYLCLGQSEGITRGAKLFATVDKKHRIFQRRETSAATLPDFPLAASAVSTRPGPAAARAVPRLQDRIDTGARRIMEKHSPAYVVIDRRHEILRFSGGEVGRYLEPTPGTATLDLFGIVRKALRPALRAAVMKAHAEEEPVTTDSVAVKIDGKSRSVKLIVEPIPESGGDGLCVVAFQEAGPVVAAEHPASAGETDHASMQALEQELHTTRAQLGAAIDELETANEEMKSANEEYQSVNEELQSSNEELETAKEEMQSVNEELQTINAEMAAKNETLTRLNSDLKNLLESTQIATIFLDGKLRIKRFTPGMTDIFHLRDGDRGRPVTDIVTRMIYADLRSDVAKVLRTLAVIEHEVRIADRDAVFVMRIRPYRTVDNVIDGVVITFMDITERKRHEDAKARLAAIVDSSDDAIMSKDMNDVLTTWNRGAERLLGYTAEEAVGQPGSILIPPGRHDEEPALLGRIRRGEHVDHYETVRRRKDGSLVEVSLTLSPIKNDNGTVIGASKVVRDITERKRAEDRQSLLIAELDHRVKNTLAIVASLVAQTLRTAGSPEAFAALLEGRIQALSRAHQILTQSSWDRAELRDVVMGELAPYLADGGGNVTAGGDSVLLTARATLTLAMALHELATNAAKHGALSTPEGRVAVTWRVADGGAGKQLAIDWIETGGPPVGAPASRGFGSEMIERAVAYELQASVQREFPPEGARCRIEFPLTGKTGHARSGDRDRK